jgi:hypothetical protein
MDEDGRSNKTTILNRFEDSEDEDLRRQIHLRRWASHELLPVVVKTQKKTVTMSRG